MNRDFYINTFIILIIAIFAFGVTYVYTGTNFLTGQQRQQTVVAVNSIDGSNVLGQDTLNNVSVFEKLEKNFSDYSNFIDQNTKIKLEGNLSFVIINFGQKADNLYVTAVGSGLKPGKYQAYFLKGDNSYKIGDFYQKDDLQKLAVILDESIDGYDKIVIVTTKKDLADKKYVLQKDFKYNEIFK